MYSKITDEDLHTAIDNSVSVMGVLRFLGRKEAGGSHSWITKRIRRDGFDTSHFTGQAHNKGKIGPRKTAEEILILHPVGGKRPNAIYLRRSLLEIGRAHTCEGCGNTGEWNGNFLVLEIDHINGQYWDDRAENLRFLCPNCHSQETIRNPTHLQPPANRSNRDQRLPLVCECGSPMSRAARTCEECYYEIQRGQRRTTKIDWPDVSDLLVMLESSSYSAVGRSLGVSDNAIRKHIRTRT